MNLISYAQNFEDIMLWRALKRVPRGFYIDAGAWSPEIDSVTKLFYERGWHGINIEPNPEFNRQLQEYRPHDLNLAVAIGDSESMVMMNFLENPGLSTADDDIARRHQRTGWELKRQQVQVTTLAAIWQRHVPHEQAVHFLKIDVEGFEEKALRGNDWSKYRPWIVVVESTLPMTQVESHAEWESIILSANYRFVYADGLNRFYVAKEHPELFAAFKYPPNVFDDFVLAQQWRVEQRMKQAIESESEAHQASRKAADFLAQAEARLAQIAEREAQALQVANQAQQAAQQAEARVAQAEQQQAQALQVANQAQQAAQQAEARVAQAEQQQAEAQQVATQAQQATQQAEQRAADAEQQQAEAQQVATQAQQAAQQAEQRAAHAEQQQAEAQQAAEQAEQRAQHAQQQIAEREAQAQEREAHAQLAVQQAVEREAQAVQQAAQAQEREAQAQQVATQAQQAAQQAEQRAVQAQEREAQALQAAANIQQVLQNAEGFIALAQPHIAHLEATVAHLEATLALNRHHLHDLQHTNAQHLLLAEQRQQRIDALLNSFSWRITAPLRLVVFLLVLYPLRQLRNFVNFILRNGIELGQRPLSALMRKVRQYPQLSERLNRYLLRYFPALHGQLLAVAQRHGVMAEIESAGTDDRQLEHPLEAMQPLELAHPERFAAHTRQIYAALKLATNPSLGEH